MVMEKKGWLVIFEATIAIVMILGMMLIMYRGQRTDFNENNYMRELQKDILMELASNDSLRTEIMNLDNLNDNNISFFIQDRIPRTWNFNFTICNLTEECEFNGEYPETDVLVQERIIAGILSDNQSPDNWKKIRLFFWRNKFQ